MNTTFWKTAIVWGITGGIIGLLIGMAIGWRMDNRVSQFEGVTGAQASTTGSASSTTSAASDSEAVGAGSASTGSTDSGAALSVSDQPAGHAVVIAHVSLSVVGWIAVHEVSATGVIGNVLGAARRNPGSYDNVVVDLLRATVPNGRYAVILYADNGNKIFDLKGDQPILGSDGKPIMSEFAATTPPSPSGR